MKIIAICPSIYPEKLARMYNSYDVTVSKNTNLIVTNKKVSVTALINEMFNKHNDADFFIVLNDDIVFNTPLWDLKLANKWKISHGSDAIENGISGQFLMIDGDIVRSLGWLQLPTLERYCGDVVWRFLGQQLGILNHVKDVEITHEWSGCADVEANTSDMGKFAEWLTVSHRDIEKIRRVI